MSRDRAGTQKATSSKFEGGGGRRRPYDTKMPERVQLSCVDVDTAETEGERQLRRLLNQQLDKNITLQTQFERHRDFRSSAPYEPFTHQLSGQLSSAQFSAIRSHRQRIDRLKQFGLNDNEVQVKLASDDGCSAQNATSRQSCSVGGGFGKLRKEGEAFKQQLHTIDTKIEEKRSELCHVSAFREAKQLGRHEMDLERSLKPNSRHAQLYSSLVTARPTDQPTGLHPQHPIHQLAQLEAELNQRIDDTVAQLRRRATNDRHHVAEPQDQSSCELLPDVPNLVRDQLVAVVPDEQILASRLSPEQIMAMRPFRYYEPGEPSNILYVKNLAATVQDTDLVALFGRFQQSTANGQPPITYRRMNGKMKGQAFVTFPDVETAQKALHLVHGFVWKGRPVVVQFGRTYSAPDPAPS